MQGNMEGSNKQESVSLDISEQFMAQFGSFENRAKYNQFLMTEEVRSSRELLVNLDFSNLDKNEFTQRARMVKAFLESARGGQDRNASIRCTKEQKSWERNVFSSGVRWIDAEV